MFTILSIAGWLGLLSCIAGLVLSFRRRLCLGLAAVSLAVVSLILSATVIPAGHIGVRKTFGRVNETSLKPGLNFVIPFADSVVIMETRIKSFAVENPPCKTKDLQLVHAVFSVQHFLNGEMAPVAYQSIGDLGKFDANVVSPAVYEATKAVVGQYKASELIRQRDQVTAKIVQAIQDNITQTLNEKGVKGALVIASVAAKDFDFSDEFNRSIEATMTSQQEALRADSMRQQQIIAAEAEARERELLAEGDAYAINAISVAQAAAIDRESKALAKGGDLLLWYRYVMSWDGKLPTSVGGIQPFMALPSGK